jgi:hypothetical protein
MYDHEDGANELFLKHLLQVHEAVTDSIILTGRSAAPKVVGSIRLVHQPGAADRLRYPHCFKKK